MDLESLRFTYLRRVVGTALGVLGLDAADRLARSMARAVHGLNTPMRRRAETRLSDALPDNCSTATASRIIAAMYEHVGRFCVEALFARRLLREASWRNSIALENEASLTALAAGGRGCLLTTAYLGNPAVAAYALGEIFHPVHVVADRFAHPVLRAWQDELVAYRNVRIVDRREATTSLPSILNRGGAVLMIGEHERRRGPCISVPFLGRTLRCYPTLARLARWHELPIAVVTCVREARPFTFRLQTHSTIAPPRDEASDAGLMEAIIGALEHAILRSPEQYLWSLAGGTANSVAPEWVAKSGAEPIGTESGSASCPTRSRTASVWQTPSAAGKAPADRASPTAPVPTA
ncbi:MAG TPA: lysophospholipid acyltransferase family protein [Phycisphaerae bacterium]|nr:lysophospholipid acyltransferase family protein [Phycisphaerae bacterium]